jgi:hypothetical protein
MPGFALSIGASLVGSDESLLAGMTSASASTAESATMPLPSPIVEVSTAAALSAGTPSPVASAPTVA